jgi:tetratricopeptide (TPR) repeat protein/cold shock CspA family protein
VNAAATAQTVEELLSQAEQAANKANWERAVEILEPAPDLVRVLDKRAFYLSRAKRYDDARAVLAVLRQKEPSNFLWHHMTGYQYYVEERYDEAVPWLVAAYKLNPSHIRNLYSLAQARRHQGDVLRAQRGAAEVLRLWHELPQEGRQREAKTFAKASYLLGKMQAECDPQGAIQLLKQAADHDPADHDPADHDKHYLLGKTYRRLGQREPASEALARARGLKPGRPYIELESADVLAAEGKIDEARRCLRRVRGVRGWQAWKAARVALSLEAIEDAKRWLDIARRDRDVRESAKYEELKMALDAAIAQRPEAEAPAPNSPGPFEEPVHRGTVHHLRAERGFGFVVDASDGARCYFKLRRDHRLSAGHAVEFVRADTKRGPAAREVRRLEAA